MSKNEQIDYRRVARLRRAWAKFDAEQEPNNDPYDNPDDCGGWSVRPGKWHKIPHAVRVFWDRALEGFSDGTYSAAGCGCYELFKLDATERAAFPELGSIYGLAIYERDDGFMEWLPLSNKRQFVALEAKLSREMCDDCEA